MKLTGNRKTVTNSIIPKPKYYAINYLPKLREKFKNVEIIPVLSIEDAIRLESNGYFLLESIDIGTIFRCASITY